MKISNRDKTGLTVSILTIAAVAVFLSSCITIVLDEDSAMYTAYNIWYRDPGEVWAINHMSGEMLPAGTKVDNVRTDTGQKYQAVHFTAGDMEFVVRINPRYNPGLTAEVLKERMLTSDSFREMTRTLDSREIAAIKEGEVIQGMSRDAVLISWGYPPKHRTRSLAESDWMYWFNRVDRIMVRFNKEGKLESVVN